MSALFCCFKHNDQRENFNNDPRENFNNDTNSTPFIQTFCSKLADVFRKEGGFLVPAAAAGDGNNTATISSNVQTGAAVTVPRATLVTANDETNPSNLNNSATISSNVQTGTAVTLTTTAAPSVVTIAPTTTQQAPACAAAAYGHVLCHKDAPQVQDGIAEVDSVIQQLIIKDQSNSIH